VEANENAFEKGGEEIVEKVVFINRSSKVVKGGRRFKFSALVVVGDKKGRVGMALGKAAEVADAIRRGGELARNKMQAVSLKGVTIPHEVYATYGGAKDFAAPGLARYRHYCRQNGPFRSGIGRHQGYFDQIARLEKRGQRGEGHFERVVEPAHPRADLPKPAVWQSKRWKRPRLPKLWWPD
jgi:hypothetical protein